MKVLIIGALPSSLVNFRGDLIRGLVDRGDEVITAASGAVDQEIADIEALGARYLDYPVARNGLNPVKDVLTLISLWKLMRSERPDVVLAYTIKPVIWGGIAASLSSGVRFYGLVTGLGFAFQKGSLLKNALVTTVSALYRLGLRKAAKVIFQNPDNRDVFVGRNIVDSARTEIVNGSGVNTHHFSVQPIPCFSDGLHFLLIARLLKDKGIREFAEAAKQVGKHYPDATFSLLGPVDPSPNGIAIGEVNGWVSEGAIKYLGSVRDVRPAISEHHVFVLPSYHEGLPRTVIEAMSMGRPVITTDAPGCRETVEDGTNGYLVSVQSADSLSKAMIKFLEQPSLVNSMGLKGREKAVSKFDVRRVNTRIMEIIGG